MADRTILCMKWGPAFGPDYVNVLFNACKKAMKRPFRFVCLTDDPTGLQPDIEPLDIPEIGLTRGQWFLPGIWPKLAIYVPQLHDIRGRCLFIDLDMMVLRDLDGFFEIDAPFVSIDVGPAWENPPRQGDGIVATGIFAFDAGQETQILDAFKADPGKALATFKNEQDFVGAYASEMGFWPPGWVLSFKRHLRQPIGLDLFKPPKEPPATCRVLAFHGEPRPRDLIGHGRYFWDRFPHMGRGKVDWAVDYWVGNGGRL